MQRFVVGDTRTDFFDKYYTFLLRFSQYCFVFGDQKMDRSKLYPVLPTRLVKGEKVEKCTFKIRGKTSFAD